MIRDIRGFIRASASTAMLLVALAGTANAAYYAKTISGTTVYSLMADTPTSAITSKVFWNGGKDLAGIATYGDYMFLSDNTSSGAVLHVMHLGGAYLGKVDLNSDGNGVKSAGAVSVDNSGRVYVTDTSTNSSAKFGMVYAPNWSKPNQDRNIAYGNVAGDWQIGLAAYSDGAAIIQRNDGVSGEIGGTAATTVDSNGNPNNKGVLEDAPSIPVAITTNRANNNAYVVTNVVTLDNDYNYVRNVTLMGRSVNWDELGSINIAGATAHDLTFVSDSVTDYVAMIGLNSGSLQVWKVGLTDGVPQLNPDAMFLARDESAVHYTTASADGKMLWVTSQAGGMVYGVDFANWGIGSHPDVTQLSVGSRIGDIAPHLYVVPEPSSIVSLIALGAGALGFMRKRK